MVGKTKGFTIVELLIVVVVIAILATITIVAYNGIQDRARSAAFTASLDSFEKKVLLQKAESGAFMDSLVPDQEITTSTGHSLLTQNSCAPGDYPQKGPFDEGECLVLSQTATYDGDTIPVQETHWSFTENQDLIDEYQNMGLGDLEPLPSDNGFSLEYSTRMQVTAAEATSYGYSNPRDGWVTIRSLQARRGATISATRVAGVVTTVGITYFLPGDQACGRGTKSLVNLGSDLAAIPDVVIVEAPSKMTQCSLTLK